MFVLPKNPNAELWDGPRTGVPGVKELFGADEAYENSQFPFYLRKLLNQTKHVFLDNPGSQPGLLSQANVKKLIETGTLIPSWLKPIVNGVYE
jgi:intermediate cleaving peptidase 55